MKNRMFLLLSVAGILGIVLTGCPPPPMEYSSADIVVNDLTCDMCVTKVEMALNALEGMHAVTVNLKEKLAAVEFEAGTLELSDIEHAIAEAGFTANGVTRNETAHQELPSCCE